MRIAAAMFVAAFGVLSAAQNQAFAKPPSPGQIVIKLDPAKDFVATKPGWAAVPDKKVLGCEVTTPNANKDPLASPPFTLVEMRAAAAKAGRIVVRTIGGKQVEGVSVTPKNGKSGFLPLTDYVDQLNAAEKWLNLYGRSLRETGGDLGVVAKLRPKLPDCTPSSPELIPIQKPPALDPGGPIQARINPGDLYLFEILGSRGDLVTPRKRLAAPTDRLAVASYRALARFARTNGRAWLQPAAGLLRRALGGEERGQSRLRALRVTSVSHQALLGDRARLRGVERLAGGLGLRVGGAGPIAKVSGDESTCPPIDGGGGDGSQTGGPQTCGVCIEDEKTSCPEPGWTFDEKGCYIPSKGQSQGSNESGGQWEVVEGKPGANLCDGTFGLTMPVWSGCVQSGLNDWFAGQSCVAITSSNKGSAGTFFFNNSVSLNTGLVFFGETLDLLTASADATFDSSTGGPKTSGPTLKGWIAEAGSTGVYSKSIDGPSTVIPIFGYPLVITSNLQIDLNGQNLKPQANALTAGCSAAPQVEAVVAVSGEALAQVRANLNAKLSIEIVEAQINAGLDILNDRINGAISTFANRGGNEVVVKPNMAYDTKKGSGNVVASFKIDLFVTSKTWAIELASWNGFQEKKTFPKEIGTAKAVTAPELVCNKGPKS
jgi:hypothetical protein